MQGAKDNVTPSNRVDVIDTNGGRILCVADIRGKLSLLNSLAAEHDAKAIIHTGDFGFYEVSSLPRVTDRTLKHLIQYSSLISPQLRSSLTAPNISMSEIRQMLANPRQPNGSAPGSSTSDSSFPLSEFPKLLTGELKLNVPVYTVWGACEDVSVLEKLRLATPGPVSINSASSQQSQQSSYSIPNLTVLSESTTRALVIGGVRFRLFGLGGVYVPHKMFDNGEGQATIAGGGGTMWTTVLQIGELVDTAARVYDPSETRILVTHSSPGRDGLMAQLALALKADLTISASLHFRYGISYNEFSIQHDAEAYKNKFAVAKAAFDEVWDTVKTQVEAVIDDGQRKFLNNALAVTSRIPDATQQGEDLAWTNRWNWNLPDITVGNLVLDIRDGRVSTEMKSQGFNFAYRANAAKNALGGSAQSVPAGPGQKHSQQASRPPSAPRQHQQNQNQTSNKPLAPTHSQSQSPFQGQRGKKSDSKSENSTLPSKPESAPSTDPNKSLADRISSPAPTAPTTNNIERPASSASSSRRASYQQNHKRPPSQQGTPKTAGTVSGDQTMNHNDSNTETAAEGDATQSTSQRGNWRGRGRGSKGRGEGAPRSSRGSFDKGSSSRGRGGNFSRGQHQAQGSSDGGSAPTASNAPAAAAIATETQA